MFCCYNSITTAGFGECWGAAGGGRGQARGLSHAGAPPLGCGSKPWRKKW